MYANFQDLSEDTIRTIFQFCDIRTVLAVCRTNKSFHLLTRDKSVWIDVVNNLRRKGFLDHLSLSDIGSHSQQALVELVKQILSGPASWTASAQKRPSFFSRLVSKSSQPPLQAQISKQFVVHPSGISMSKRNQAQLLPGGEYVLFNNTTLECWSVREDKLIWTYDKNGPDYFVTEFAADVLEGGKTANIIVCERSWDIHDGARDILIQILHLDFGTGASYRHLRNIYPDKISHCSVQVYICGELACVFTESLTDPNTPSYYQSIILDWQTNSQFTLAASTSDSLFLLALIPKHVIFAECNPDGTSHIGLIHTNAFSHHWKPCSPDVRINWQYAIHTTKNITCQRFPIDLRLYAGRSNLCAHASPLEDGLYRVWITISGFKLASGKRYPRTSVYRYGLQLPTSSRGLQVRREAKIFAPPGPRPYSGHTIFRDIQMHWNIFSLQESGPAVDLGFEAGTPPHLSAYSGAITYSTRNSVVVAYFK